MLIERPMQQRRQHHGVTEAADREQFGCTLQDRDDDGLECTHAAFLTEGGGFGKVGARSSDFPVIASRAKQSPTRCAPRWRLRAWPWGRFAPDTKPRRRE